MLKLNRRIFLCAVCAVCWNVLANAQVLHVIDNATVKANIANTAPTRIALENDRIAVLRGVEGAYTYSNDNQSGAVFLKPTDAYKNKSFYVFINTEHNHNYILQLKPTAKLSAGMLILKSRDQALSAVQQWETNSPYTDTLTTLITDMVNQNTPESYEVIPINRKKTTPVGTQLRIRLKKIYAGAHLQGQIFEVTNKSLLPVTLIEHMFYQSGDRAIALRDSSLPAGGKTWLYKVSNHG